MDSDTKIWHRARMSNLIKICGLSTSEAVAASRAGGASHLGFIFFPKSPRNVTPQQAASLVKHAGDARTVAVTVDAEDAFLDTIVETMKPDFLQLHGSETIQRVKDIKTRYSLPVIKALAIRDLDDITRAETYQQTVDILLLDAKPPKGSDLPGGNGVSFDWSLLDTLSSKIPVLLSGGIDLTNLADALATMQKPESAVSGLDLSSGVESAPGVKDISKIKALLAACR